MSRWIKKGNLYGALAAAGLIWLLVFLFLDPLLKRALISAGQKAAGARVEVGSVRTRLLRGSLVISKVAVADKHEPMKNLVELETADFKLSPGAALRAKAVIDDASISGIRLGTPRKTSGALPRAQPSHFEKMLSEQLLPAKEKALTAVKAVKTEVDPKKLSSRAALDAAQQKVDALEARAKDHAGADIAAEVKQLQAEKNPLEAARKGKALLDDVKKSKEGVEHDLGEVKAALAKAEDLRKKDLSGLMSEAGLPSLDADSLTRRLIGPAAAKKLSTALYWIKWARERQAKSQREKATNPPPTPKGVNIEFPVKNALPAFLLRRAGLDGRVDDLFHGQAMNLKGELKGVTSNPPLYGKPATFELSGAAAGGVSMRLDGTIDQTRADGATEVRLRYAGFPLAGTSLGDPEMSATLAAGVGRLDGALKIAGDSWSGRFVLDAERVKLEPKLAGLDARATRVAESALRGVKHFTATIGVQGTGEDIHLTVTSDLGRVLADGMKAAVSGELAAQRRELEKKLDAAVGPQQRALQQKTAGLEKQLLAPLEKQQAAINEQLRKGLPKGLDKLFR